jgi:hypothetical protein
MFSEGCRVDSFGLMDLVIEAYTGNEVITLKITSTLLGTYFGNSTEGYLMS